MNESLALTPMGLNQSEATPDSERHNRFGKHYWDIDFYPNEKLTQFEYSAGYERNGIWPVIGLLQVGKYRIPVTIKEMERIKETILDAGRTMEMSYKLGYLK